MEALQKAQQLAEQAESYYDTAEQKDGNAFYRGRGDEAMEHAGIYAAIAQAEQLKRMADAAERRNVLLEEYNAESKASADRHTQSIATSVGKFVNAVYGEDDPK